MCCSCGTRPPASTSSQSRESKIAEGLSPLGSFSDTSVKWVRICGRCTQQAPGSLA